MSGIEFQKTSELSTKKYLHTESAVEGTKWNTDSIFSQICNKKKSEFVAVGKKIGSNKQTVLGPNKYIEKDHTDISDSCPVLSPDSNQLYQHIKQ